MRKTGLMINNDNIYILRKALEILTCEHRITCKLMSNFQKHPFLLFAWHVHHYIDTIEYLLGHSKCNGPDGDYLCDPLSQIDHIELLDLMLYYDLLNARQIQTLFLMIFRTCVKRNQKQKDNNIRAKCLLCLKKRAYFIGITYQCGKWDPISKLFIGNSTGSEIFSFVLPLNRFKCRHKTRGNRLNECCFWVGVFILHFGQSTGSDSRSGMQNWVMHCCIVDDLAFFKVPLLVTADFVVAEVLLFLFK